MNLKTLLHGLAPGGQLTTTTLVENYVGFSKIDGFELTQKMFNHAQDSSAICSYQSIVSLRKLETCFQVETDDDQIYVCKCLILATGAFAKCLKIAGEDILWQKGISACAVCDGALPMFRNQPVMVVGGGDIAMEESMHLARFASVVYLVHRNDRFRASKIMLERVKNNPKIQIMINHQVLQANPGPDDNLESVIVSDSTLGKSKIYEIPVRGLFYAIGHIPKTAFW